ncbi:MAG: Bifunctional protein GlmU [Pseudomonadota bacterium]
MGCILKGGGGLYSRVAIGAVLLAAGSASRMGHRPKCLLELGGVPLIRRQLIALSGAGVDELVVVLGHYSDRIEQVVQDFPVTLVRNPDPEAGQVSSLRLGLQALSPMLYAALTALADQPLKNSQ